MVRLSRAQLIALGLALIAGSAVALLWMNPDALLVLLVGLVAAQLYAAAHLVLAAYYDPEHKMPVDVDEARASQRPVLLPKEPSDMSSAYEPIVLLPRADMRRACGRAIIFGFDGKDVNAELRELIREVEPLGLILFSRNIESVEHLAELNRELKALRPDAPLLLCVDQEGGRVARVREPATLWPPMRQVGLLDDPGLARRVGRALARELRALSFDVDFAPVLDVDTNPKNPVIGDRSFSSDPRVVARLAAAFIQGMQGEGVGACGKHFPGHGDTDLDSHLALPRVEHELGRLREIEWPPFRAAIEAGVSSIMTAHVITSCLDESVPATLSKKALAPLRDELGFRGVVVSDDLEMKAVADHFPIDELAVRGMNAGCDVFLACHKPDVVLGLYRALVRAVEDRRITHRTLVSADQRTRAWRDAYVKPASPKDAWRGVVGCAEHQDLAGEIVDRASRG